jgi:plasmid maintenance system antidote protein VapI
VRSVVDPRFSVLLREHMTVRGMTQAALAGTVFMSPGHLSDIVRGKKQATPDMARAFDAALDAGGELIAAANSDVVQDDAERFAALLERPSSVSLEAVDALSRSLAALRDLDDQVGSAKLVRQVTATLRTVSSMVSEARGEIRPVMVQQAGQWAQFLGWLSTSTARWDSAQHWFRLAGEWGVESGDPDLEATVASYLGHVAWLTGNPEATVLKSKAALRYERAYVGQRAYDAYQLARGHAAVGQIGEARSALALGDDLVAESYAFDGFMPAWHYYRTPGFWALERGLAGRYIACHDDAYLQPAIADLERGLALLGDEVTGADWAAEYMTVGLASAHLDAGDKASAESVLRRARRIAEKCDSSRVLALVEGRELRLAALR